MIDQLVPLRLVEIVSNGGWNFRLVQLAKLNGSNITIVLSADITINKIIAGMGLNNSRHVKIIPTQQGNVMERKISERIIDLCVVKNEYS